MYDTTRVVAITTIDNPYDPIDQWAEWYEYDTNVLHYDTCAYLARLARTSDALSEYFNSTEMESAIDEIVKLDLIGKYKKVVKHVSNS